MSFVDLMYFLMYFWLIFEKSLFSLAVYLLTCKTNFIVVKVFIGAWQINQTNVFDLLINSKSWFHKLLGYFIRSFKATMLQMANTTSLFSSRIALVLLSVVLVSLLVNQGRASENQRLFNNAVIRVQHLHQLAAKMINDFVRFPFK